MVTMDSDMSRKLILANMDRARVSMKARIMLTSSSAEQYLEHRVNYMPILPSEKWLVMNIFLNSNVIHWQIVYTVPPIIIFQGHQHLAAYLGPQELLGVMEASLN